ncbi:hypothetical protein [Leptospira kirschneri]|uniref:hypothetical protein n=1 Tax=Leptospira kirschneri TaxID=29507 RepID=UPI000365585B|nr:hypothetical protein [Leptospira kirschneri]
MSNYVIDKYSKKVIWINPDLNQLSEKSAWSDFNSEMHEIVHAIHYNPQIGDLFKADIANGIATDFEPKKVYDKNSMAKRTLLSWGEEIDSENETEAEPMKDENGVIFPNQIYTPSGWIVNVEQKRNSLIGQVNSICASEIVSGFFSSALGSPHLYSSDQDDQLNLIGLVSINEIVMCKCTDQNGVKEYRAHTAEQIRRVLGDGAARKTLLLQKAFALKTLLQNASSAEELSSVDIQTNWE